MVCCRVRGDRQRREAEYGRGWETGVVLYVREGSRSWSSKIHGGILTMVRLESQCSQDSKRTNMTWSYHIEDGARYPNFSCILHSIQTQHFVPDNSRVSKTSFSCHYHLPKCAQLKPHCLAPYLFVTSTRMCWVWCQSHCIANDVRKPKQWFSPTS